MIVRAAHRVAKVGDLAVSVVRPLVKRAGEIDHVGMRGEHFEPHRGVFDHRAARGGTFGFVDHTIHHKKRVAVGVAPKFVVGGKPGKGVGFHGKFIAIESGWKTDGGTEHAVGVRTG